MMNKLISGAGGFALGFAAMNLVRSVSGEVSNAGLITFQNAIFVILAIAVLVGNFTGFGE